MGVGAMTDFGPMIADPDTMLLGAASSSAYSSRWRVRWCWAIKEAYHRDGGADGPTSIRGSGGAAPLGCDCGGGHSYMSLVPLIQPPVMTLFDAERA